MPLCPAPPAPANDRLAWRDAVALGLGVQRPKLEMLVVGHGAGTLWMCFNSPPGKVSWHTLPFLLSSLLLVFTCSLFIFALPTEPDPRGPNPRKEGPLEALSQVACPTLAQLAKGPAKSQPSCASSWAFLVSQMKLRALNLMPRLGWRRERQEQGVCTRHRGWLLLRTGSSDLPRSAGWFCMPT